MGAVGWLTAGAGALQGLAPASAIWMSVGIVRCATPRRVRACRMAMSRRVGELRRHVDHLVVLGHVDEQASRARPPAGSPSPASASPASR